MLLPLLVLLFVIHEGSVVALSYYRPFAIPHQEPRHFDRSASQFYREVRSGEIPAFGCCLFFGHCKQGVLCERKAKMRMES